MKTKIAEIKGAMINKKPKVTSHALCSLSCCCDEEVKEFNTAIDQQGQVALDVKIDREALAKIVFYYYYMDQMNPEGEEWRWQEYLDAIEHRGDCTNECYTCLVCQKEDIFKFIDILISQKDTFCKIVRASDNEGTKGKV